MNEKSTTTTTDKSTHLHEPTITSPFPLPLSLPLSLPFPVDENQAAMNSNKGPLSPLSSPSNTMVNNVHKPCNYSNSRVQPIVSPRKYTKSITSQLHDKQASSMAECLLKINKRVQATNSNTDVMMINQHTKRQHTSTTIPAIPTTSVRPTTPILTRSNRNSPVLQSLSISPRQMNNERYVGHTYSQITPRSSPPKINEDALSPLLIEVVAKTAPSKEYGDDKGDRGPLFEFIAA